MMKANGIAPLAVAPFVQIFLKNRNLGSAGTM